MVVSFSLGKGGPIRLFIYETRPAMHLADFIRILNVAVGPTILISAVGLLLLSMTNRFGRVIDRSRILLPRLAPDGGERSLASDDIDRVFAQLWILARRARALRTAITMAVLSVLLSVVLVMGLFVAAACGCEGPVMTMLLTSCFVTSMAALVAALGLFLYELNLSLRALWLELPAECRRRRRQKTAV